MKKRIRVALVTVGIYVAIGLVFSIEAQPQQMWTCRDPSAPHGITTYGDASDVPSDDCLPTVSTAERLEITAFATAAWLPLVVLKGLSNASR
ncbi:hypothetical protein [Promicromonospora aerolata]|uniref:Uncharacterized protein n=1 Tax=Promicromonospora aerolata TaxID=195749 RepID=A0ABW4V8T6_9MICO